MNELAIRFSPLGHRYYDGEREVPSVTGVLKAAGLTPDFSMIPPEVLEPARARGDLVHAVVRAVDTGQPIAAELREDAGGYLAAYERFCVEARYRPIACELPLYSRMWGFAGTPDKVGFLGARRILPDIKTPAVLDRVSVAPQLAAYEQLWNENHTTEPLDGCMALQLRPDGTYRLVPLETARAFRIFIYALKVTRDQATPSEKREIAAWIADHRRIPCPT